MKSKRRISNPKTKKIRKKPKPTTPYVLSLEDVLDILEHGNNEENDELEKWIMYLN